MVLVMQFDPPPVHLPGGHVEVPHIAPVGNLFQEAPPEVSLRSGAQESSPRGLRAGGGGGAQMAPPCVHPQKWTEEQVRTWWERRTRRRKDIGTPARGTDGRNIMRWPISRFEQLCNGNNGMAVALYQDLRNEIERYEQWRRTGAVEPDDAPILVPSPRAPSRRCRQTYPPEDNVTKVPTKPVPNDVVFGFGGVANLVPGGGTSPGRGSPTLRARQGASGGAAPGLDEGEKARRATAANQAKAAVAQAKAAVAAATAAGAAFKFNPARRPGAEQTQANTSSAAPPSNPLLSAIPPQAQPAQPPASTPTLAQAAAAAAQKRAATAVDHNRSTRDKMAASASGSKPAGQGGSGAAGAGNAPCAKVRTKSAPRATRPTAPPPAAPAVAAAAAVAPTPARNPSASGGELEPRRRQRSKVFEDLGDETLAQVGSPKKPERPDVKKSVPRVARDDSELPTKHAKGANNAPEATAESKNEDEDCSRRMFDKRELRRRHKALFEQQLAFWREQHAMGSASGSGGGEAAPSRVRVCVRKRPLFDYERQAEEFDVVTVRTGTEVVVHNCLTKADLRSLFVSHMGFQFYHAFGETANDDEVFAQCAAPAVRHTQQGGVATIFMFGQTGSGKTHTMAGLLRRAAAQLFGGSSNFNGEERTTLGLVAFEIAGKTMRDLLDVSGVQKELKVMEDKEHRTHVLGVKACDAHNADELLSRITGAQAQRATRATQVNDTSSRSHAVYRIWHRGSGSSNSTSSGPPPGAAILTLVDCAGSERREDSSHHDVQSRKDAAEINSTIFALKECFRVMRSSRSGQQPPYRESLLTRVLSDSFSSERAQIVAIGTVSPSATDTEHSIGTLRALQQLQGTQMSFESREDVAKPKVGEPHPRTWSEEDVKQWMETAIGGKARAFVVGVSRGTDGKNLLRWPVQRFTMLCGGEENLGQQLYQDLRHKIKMAA